MSVSRTMDNSENSNNTNHIPSSISQDSSDYDWMNGPCNVDSLWIIKNRDKSGKHSNIYHGNFIPQIPNQLIRRYTQPNDIILELFSGSGTTFYECEKLSRHYIGFDINQEMIEHVKSQANANNNIKYLIGYGDVTKEDEIAPQIEEFLAKLSQDQSDFLLLHPPYLDIIKFTDDSRDLSHISSSEIFIDKIISSLRIALRYLKNQKYFAVVMGDIYRNKEVIPLSFLIMNAIRQTFSVKLKGIVIKNINGNRGKLGVNDIWKYRALKSDYYLFKHEYIFVFKKDE